MVSPDDGCVSNDGITTFGEPLAYDPVPYLHTAYLWCMCSLFLPLHHGSVRLTSLLHDHPAIAAVGSDGQPYKLEGKGFNQNIEMLEE